jgi:hypothetical protein
MKATPAPATGGLLSPACARPALIAPLTVIGLAVLLATTVSPAVTVTLFDARQWGLYTAATVLLALTLGLLGVLLGPISDGPPECSSPSSSDRPPEPRRITRHWAPWTVHHR